jgi:hypothetical protein
MRRLVWPVILFQLFWLNVFVPGHTRGAITMPGAHAAEASGCCEPQKSDTGKPTPEQQRRCAVCYIVAGYSLPPVFDIDLRPMGLLAIIADHQNEDAPLLALMLSYHANAPPCEARNTV